MAKVNGVELVVKPLPDNKVKLKATYPMTPKGYTLHNTYNDASAENEIKYMQYTNPKSTSYHYAIDNLGAIQGLPLDRNGWHAGDGSNGYGNRNTYGVEICYSKSGGEKYDKAEDNAILFVAQGLYDNGWDISKVWKHQDWSGKNCPHRILARSRGWEGIIAEIKKELDRLKGSNTDKPAAKPKPTTPAAKPTASKSIETLAREVMAGKHGTGEARKKALGDKYPAVQKRVNQLAGVTTAKPKPAKTTEQLAKEVIDGRHGSGAARKKALGDRYQTVQARVNQLLGTKKATTSKSVKQLADEVIKGLHGSGRERMNSLGSKYAEVQKEVNRRLK